MAIRFDCQIHVLAGSGRSAVSSMVICDEVLVVFSIVHCVGVSVATGDDMRARSRKAANIAARRAKLLRRLLAEGARCEIGPALAEHGIWTGCVGVVSGLHERRKRSAAGSLLNEKNLVPACSVCNCFIEDFPALVREKTGCRFVVRPGDDEWDDLGVDPEI